MNTVYGLLKKIDFIFIIAKDEFNFTRKHGFYIFAKRELKNEEVSLQIEKKKYHCTVFEPTTHTDMLAIEVLID